MCVPPEYALFEVDMLLRVPAGMSFEAAATFPVGLFTAAMGLYAPYGAGLRPLGSPGNDDAVLVRANQIKSNAFSRA